MGYRKAKSRKTCCKNNQMHLLWTGDSHFVGSSFWFLFNKFIPNGIRPVDNNFVTPSQEGVTKLLSTPIFSVFMGVSGLFKAGFSKPPHRGCPTPKRAKRQKNASLFLLGKRFCHFLDTGSEMIFDCLSGLSWGLTGEGGDGVWPAAGTEND